MLFFIVSGILLTIAGVVYDIFPEYFGFYLAILGLSIITGAFGFYNLDDYFKNSVFIQ